MSLYLLLDLLVILFPFVLSFDRKVAFYRHWPATAASIVIVGAVYIIWDVFATLRGDWSFSKEYTGGLRIAGLPIEEILFFVVVPYACIFILEVVRAYFREREFTFPRGWLALLGTLLLTVGLVFYTRPYTLTVFAVTGAFFFIAGLIGREQLGRRSFWLALAISYIPFLIANGVLTGMPIVLYGEGHILGIRIGTIPLEDFFYSFSMLGFNYLVFLLLRDVWVLGRSSSARQGSRSHGETSRSAQGAHEKGPQIEAAGETEGSQVQASGRPGGDEKRDGRA
jgi:lycopene cyclase domain-containing protein